MKGRRAMQIYRTHVLVCGGTPCVLKGSMAVKEALEAEIKANGLTDEVKVVETGCLGPCDEAPLVVVYPDGLVYSGVKTSDVNQIVTEHLLKGRPVERLKSSKEMGQSGGVTNFQDKYIGIQDRIVLRNCGRIDPDSIQEYIANDGYSALVNVLTKMSSEEVISLVKESGLRGRGGAGFSTGLKWSFTAQAQGDQKYIICNADEGEPGTFKDRLILEGDPHSIIEAMAIAGYAVGSDKGYVYIRGEYDQSIQKIKTAISKAKEEGFLGKDILGTGFSFDIEVREGAGAYICGEETALIESIEGKRGEPRIKPPYPPVSGLWGKPTIVNNVETLANIPRIILNGPEWFNSKGTKNCPGTKVFTLIGDINNRGLIEVPMGITLRQIIYEIGGGIPGGRKFKLAQTGGTSGGCLPEEMLDIPMDYDTLAEAGSALGSGAMLIMDDTHSIIDIAKSFMKFFLHESCGKCTPCRQGTAALYHIICNIEKGIGKEQDIEDIKTLCDTMKETAFCGLGQAAPNPIITTLKYFEEEYYSNLVMN